MANAHYKRLDDKTVAVYIQLKNSTFEIGRTKLECDAQMHVHKINEAIDEARTAGYTEGYEHGRQDEVERGQ